MSEALQYIPLNKLSAWTGNVRKTDPDTGIAELSASIAAHGLLQSLVVREHKRGKYSVIAGRRRLQALQSLSKEGKLDAEFAIPCRVISKDQAAAEISLAENIVRESMHPADEFTAFRELIDAGACIADIAARFGYSESTVEKRLRLARVSPVIFEAYRTGEMSLEQIMAFAVSDDHEAQERLWCDGAPWMRTNPRAIREALTEHEIAATDRLVEFATLEAYENAGGQTRRDLFSDGPEGVFILDAPLLHRLAAEKLEKIAKNVREEGWKWVETRLEFDYSHMGEFQRRYPEKVPLSETEAAELASIEQEIDASYDIEGELTDEQQAYFDALTQRMDALTEGRETVWPAETLSIAGAVLSIDYDGEASITRGLIRPEDAPQKAKADSSDDEARATKRSPSLPSSLIESLTAHRSAALSSALMDQPGIALACVVHIFASEVFYGRGVDSSLQISLSAQSLKRVQGSPAFEAIERARMAWREQMPADQDHLWSWCLEQPMETLLGLLGFCAALSVDAIDAKGKVDAGRLDHANELAKALTFDIGAWFQPTAENYFSKISKTQMISALQEAKGVPPAPAWASMKKAELAALAEREITGKGWIPAPIRNAETVQAE